MIPRSVVQRGMVAAILCLGVAVGRAQVIPEHFSNLEVLPKDITPEDLRATMAGFTRALGVRCSYCHVSQEGKPPRPEDYALDDKLTKRKARDMLRMTKDINDIYLTRLESRATPQLTVRCITCHHGVPQPRTLQDVLKQPYDTGGVDSTVARYQSLRERYYGRFAYDFGEVPLADVATQVHGAGHDADAERLLALNVDQNPKSAFAKRQHAGLAIERAFQQSGPDSGTAAYRTFAQRYGVSVVGEELMDGIGSDLLAAHQVDPAIEAFKLNAAEHPNSARALESLGRAYMAKGDWKSAKQACAKWLVLDPANADAQAMMVEIQSKGKKKTARP